MGPYLQSGLHKTLRVGEIGLKKILMFLFRRYLLSRILLWYRMLRNLHGITSKDKLALYLSAIMDVVWCMFHPRICQNPICRFSCTVYAPELNVRFCIRKGSDDLYSVLPYREGDAHDAILSPLSEGDVFVDVGANVGYYSILASKRVGSLGHVIAIEPFPGTVEQLKRNINANRAYNVEVIKAAVWSESGKKVALKFAKGFWGQVKVDTEAETINDRYISVSTRCIDDICRAYPYIKVLKLDIEGAEYEALKGAPKTLSKVQFVVVECSQNQRQIVQLLTEMGFQIKKLNFATYILAERKPIK